MCFGGNVGDSRRNQKGGDTAECHDGRCGPKRLEEVVLEFLLRKIMNGDRPIGNAEEIERKQARKTFGSAAGGKRGTRRSRRPGQ